MRPRLFILFSGNGPSLTGGFNDTDIERVKQSIRSEFGERQGVTVVAIELIKESPKKLSGFVKVNVPLIGETTKACTATMGKAINIYGDADNSKHPLEAQDTDKALTDTDKRNRELGRMIAVVRSGHRMPVDFESWSWTSLGVPGGGMCRDD